MSRNSVSFISNATTPLLLLQMKRKKKMKMMMMTILNLKEKRR